MRGVKEREGEREKVRERERLTLTQRGLVYVKILFNTFDPMY